MIDDGIRLYLYLLSRFKKRARKIHLTCDSTRITHIAKKDNQKIIISIKQHNTKICRISTNFHGLPFFFSNFLLLSGSVVDTTTSSFLS